MPDLPQKHDYQANSNKAKAAQAKPPKPKPEKVVVSEVVVEKQTLGQKFKATFLDKEFFTQLVKDVYRNRVVPNAKNMVFDTGMEMLKQSVYKTGDPRAILDPRNIAQNMVGGMTRFTYNAPVQRSMPYPNAIPTSATMMTRAAQPQNAMTRRYGRPSGDNYIIPTREEADLALETMVDFIEAYGVATMQDYQEILGVPIDPLGAMWGWTNLRDAEIIQHRGGFVINLPQAEPLQIG